MISAESGGTMGQADTDTSHSPVSRPRTNEAPWKLIIRDDGLVATLHVPPHGACDTDWPVVNRLIAESGIIHGLQIPTIQEAIRAFARPTSLPQTYPIAVGQAPEACSSLALDTAVELTCPDPAALRASHHAVQRWQAELPWVEAGEEIAEVRVPGNLRTGLSVLGEVLLPALRATERLTLDSSVEIRTRGERVWLHARRRGIPQIIGHQVAVYPLRIVADRRSLPEPGEVEPGHLLVVGRLDKHPDLQVAGNLFVTGGISESSLNVGGNLIAGESLLGRGREHLVVAGDLRARSAERYEIDISGHAHFESGLAQVKARVRGVLRVDEGISGGSSTAGLRIIASRLGSPSGTPTDIIVDRSLRHGERLRELEFQARSIREELSRIHIARLRRVRLGPGELSSPAVAPDPYGEREQLQETLRYIESEHDRLTDELTDESAWIVATQQVHPGVRFRIGEFKGESITKRGATEVRPGHRSLRFRTL